MLKEKIKINEIEPSVVDKKILNSIEKEKSLLGKELLICDQLEAIKHEHPKKEAKNLIIFYLSRLSKYNEQITKSLLSELEDEKSLLKKRVSRVMSEKDIEEEMYKNLLRAADIHFKRGKTHLKKFDGTEESYHHATLAHHHKERAEDVYKTLLGKDLKKVLKHLAFVKLAEIYAQVVDKAEELNTLIVQTTDHAHKNRMIDKKIHDVHRLVAEQNLSLRHFAINYSKSLIHSAEFVDHMNNKIVIYQFR